MAKNSIDTYGAKGKTNLLMFDPEGLVLVVDKTSPLYDDRVHLPLKESMVRNVMTFGVKTPITVRRNPETGLTEVVVGRQRVKSAREANKRRVVMGLPPLQVPATVSRQEGADLAASVVIENELRDADTPLGRASKMRNLQGLGFTDSQVADTFGCTQQTVANTLALLDCTDAVRKAVEASKVNVSHALKLSKLKPDEQREKVAQLIEAGAGAKPHERARKQRAVVDTGPRMRSRKEVAAALEGSAGDVRSALAWVLGQAEALPGVV